MAYNKKTWKARQGLGLNKFSIDGATPVPVINQPDSVTQQGDALSAGNLNDLEQRIADAFDDVEEGKDALQSQINQHESRLENLEQKAGDYTTVQYRGTDAVPTGKAKYGLVKSFVGKSRAWNQLVKNGNFADSSGWTASAGTGGSSSVADNVMTVTKASEVSVESIQIYRSDLKGIIGHKYLVLCDMKSSISLANTRLYLNGNEYSWDNTDSSISTSWKQLYKIVTLNNTYNTYINFLARQLTSLTDSFTISFQNVICRDLTLIFGAGNEPSTVADALAQLPALGQYNAYDAGSLVSTEVSGVKSVGVNIWDEEWENGYYITSGKVSNANYIRSKNYIKANKMIYINSPISLDVFGYNSDTEEAGTSLGDIVKNTYVDATKYAFIRFSTSVQESSYHNNIQLCDNSLPSDIKTTYHPYMTDTLSLPTTVTLRSAGSVADTDELNVEVNGVARRRQIQRIGRVDLGSLDWTKNQNRFYATISDAYYSSDNTTNILCEKYIAKGEDLQGNMWLYTGKIYIHDENYADADAFKTAMDGVMLNYELAAPVVTLLDPITENFIEVEGGGTVETIQTQTPVIDNCLDVGYLTV